MKEEKHLFVNCYGLCSLYRIINDYEDMLNILNRLKKSTLDDCITGITVLSGLGKIKLIRDYETEVNEIQLSNEYDISLSIRYQ